MIDGLGSYIIDRGPFLLFVVLAVIGVYLMASHRNFLKGMIGLYFFQTSAIVFFVAIGFRVDGTVPIAVPDGSLTLHNPLPHAMMLTAIVVGVATLGMAIAILRRIQDATGSIEDHPEPVQAS